MGNWVWPSSWRQFLLAGRDAFEHHGECGGWKFGGFLVFLLLCGLGASPSLRQLNFLQDRPWIWLLAPEQPLKDSQCLAHLQALLPRGRPNFAEGRPRVVGSFDDAQSAQNLLANRPRNQLLKSGSLFSLRELQIVFKSLLRH